MAHPSPLPTDHDVRELVATDLASTLFVEAGAGSGKTTVCIDRVCALVESGIDGPGGPRQSRSPRRPLQSCGLAFHREVLTSHETEAGDATLAVLGEAPMSIVSTHSLVGCFTQHGLTVGVPPRFEVRDEVGEAIYLKEEIGVSSPRSCSTRKAHWPRSWCGPSSSASSPATSERSCYTLHRSYDRLRESDRVWVWPAEAAEGRARRHVVVRPVLVDAEHRRRSGACRVRRPRPEGRIERSMHRHPPHRGRASEEGC